MVDYVKKDLLNSTVRNLENLKEILTVESFSSFLMNLEKQYKEISVPPSQVVVFQRLVSSKDLVLYTHSALPSHLKKSDILYHRTDVGVDPTDMIFSMENNKRIGFGILYFMFSHFSFVHEGKYDFEEYGARFKISVSRIDYKDGKIRLAFAVNNSKHIRLSGVFRYFPNEGIRLAGVESLPVYKYDDIKENIDFINMYLDLINDFKFDPS